MLLFSGSSFALCNIDITSPNGGEYLSGTVDITWAIDEDDPGDCTGVLLDIEYDDGGGNVLLSDAIAPNDLTYSWNTNLSDETTVGYITITPDDGGGVGQSDATFTVDNTAPTITPVSISSDNANTSLAKLGDTITISFTSNEDLADTPTVFIA